MTDRVWLDRELEGFIDPDELLAVQLRADKIPDRSVVRKVTGTREYVLRRKITIYQDNKGEKPLEIEGIFLASHNGDINQIPPDKILCWVIQAEGLYEHLSDVWQEISQ